MLKTSWLIHATTRLHLRPLHYVQIVVAAAVGQQLGGALRSTNLPVDNGVLIPVADLGTKTAQARASNHDSID